MHTDSRLELHPVEDFHPYPAGPGKHRLPTAEYPKVEKPAPPAWAAADYNLPASDLVGEGPTRILLPQAQSPSMPLPARAPQKARWWNVRFGPLGRGLSALRSRP